MLKKAKDLVDPILAFLTPRRAALLAAALLGLAFAFPLWRIELYAPQYPEGLTMYIWINRMAGEVSQVNLLNHYVGMKKIDALAIPELVFMPKILLALIAAAVLAGLPNRRWLLGLWYAAFVAVGTAGLWDFYRWEYDYGHNLNPHAPIQMAGMNYQPPLFGSKTLLNITAISLPDWGGIAIFIAAVAALLPLVGALRKSKPLAKALPAAAATLGLLGCSISGPAAIHVGQDACDFCRMTISDGKFGGEVRLTKGKVLKFDSLDCLASYARTNKDAVKEVYVADFFAPGHLIQAQKAVFGKLPGVRGPMGSAWVGAADATRLREAVPWNAVVAGS